MTKYIMLLGLLLGAGSVSGQTFELQHDHSNILVSDLEVSGLFYTRILHLKALETPWGSNPDVRFFSIGGGRQIHMVRVAAEDITPNKITHLAFNISNLDEYMRYLEEQGIAYANFSGNSTSPQIRPDGVRQVYFQDPDGNWIEVNDAKY